MKILSASTTIFVFVITAFMTLSLTKPETKTTLKTISANPKIQVAILLDVSNSMDGLIEQAKAQLWNMVSVMGKAKCGNGNTLPKIEIALYEYGRDSNDPKVGYIKQISPFSSDLDQLSQELFRLTTNGGEEYCGYVIHTSLNELSWDSLSNDYKVIFIAGNEDFLQGSVSYTQACAEAKKKGVIVNTIYCGDRLQGIKEHWNLAGKCGNGSYTNINQDAKLEDIPTPYDSTLVVLNNKLNGTYLYYGEAGALNFSKQKKVDQLNSSMSNSVGLKRATAKSNPNLYRNAGWDMVDAYKADSTGFVKKVEMKTLPDSLKNKSREELQQIVNAKANERGLIQKEIQTISTQRENYISAERAKTVINNNTTTLETEVEKIIREQVKRFNMRIQ
jgi:hypothetical protein